MGRLNLPENYIYAGRHYGPGEVEIEDEEAYKAIKGKLDAAEKAKAEALLTAGPIVSEPPTDAEQETAAGNRAAEKRAR